MHIVILWPVQFLGSSEAGLAKNRENTAKYPYVQNVWIGPCMPRIMLRHVDTIKQVMQSSGKCFSAFSGAKGLKLLTWFSSRTIFRHYLSKGTPSETWQHCNFVQRQFWQTMNTKLLLCITVLCCLMTPSLSNNIQCHVWSYSIICLQSPD